MNNSDDDIKAVTPKKRGRPRKNVVVENKTIDKKKSTEELKKQREIILHLPISMDSKSPPPETDSVKLIESDKGEPISDSKNDHINNENTNNENINNTFDLMEQIKMKDKIIRKLKVELSKFKPTEDCTIRDNNYYPINTMIIDKYTGKEILNKKPGIVCWWDTCEFDNEPFYIPEKVDNNQYHVFGCFCSYNCAVSYNLNMNDYKMYDRYSLIKKLYVDVIDYNEEIVLAASREVLEKYGGPLTITEYRENFITLDYKEYKILMPPMIPTTLCVEERTRDRNVTNRKDRKIDKKSSSYTIFDTFKNKQN